MQENNVKLRNCLRDTGVKKWQLAESLNIRPSVLSEQLRHELPEEVQKKYISHVKKIADSMGSIAG